MYRVLSLALLVFLLSAAVSSQSGRKVAATPTPSPVDDPLQYSESKPRPPRVIRPSFQMPAILPPALDAKQDDPDTETLKVETNLVTIPVSVFDRDGLYIPGLRAEDFKIFEDGVQQDIAYFGTQDKPFTVALLIDTSPSTQYKIEEIHEAAIAFVNQLKANDRVIVIEFHDSVKIQCEATTDRQKIIKGIKKAKYGSGTSLYNAVDEALRKQLGKIEGRKAVVLFTDGVDTTSRKNSYDSTMNYAEESDSLIFPIYYNTFRDNLSNNAGIFGGIFGLPTGAGLSSEEYAVGRRYLEELADVTGGRVFRPESTPGGLTRAFEGIAEELRRQYNIGYVPAAEGRMGQRKSIKVRVNRPNLIIRARDSYVVGSSMAPAAEPQTAPSPTPNKPKS